MLKSFTAGEAADVEEAYRSAPEGCWEWRALPGWAGNGQNVWVTGRPAGVVAAYNAVRAPEARAEFLAMAALAGAAVRQLRSMGVTVPDGWTGGWDGPQMVVASSWEATPEGDEVQWRVVVGMDGTPFWGAACYHRREEQWPERHWSFRLAGDARGTL